MSSQNVDCGYRLEPPCRGGANEYPQSMFWIKNKKIKYSPVNPSFPDRIKSNLEQWKRPVDVHILVWVFDPHFFTTYVRL